MMACTSPASTSRLIPCRISLPATRALNSEILSNIVSSNRRSTDRAFQTHAQQILRLHGEFHRQLLEHHLAKAADDHIDRVFRSEEQTVSISPPSYFLL